MSHTRDFSLRGATAEDWPAIRSLLEVGHLPLAGARDHLGDFLVAVRDGVVVGCAGAEIYGDVALMRSLAVAPNLQGQGIGRAVVDTLCAGLARRGVRSVHLLTVTAPRYFERMGFRRRAPGTAPPALAASAEFQGACPASAVLMSADLGDWPRPPAVDVPPVAVIGAGPVGLAAVARLLERGIEPLVLEAGDSVGANLLAYGHVRLFSPWRHDIDPAMAAQLRAAGWVPPADDVEPLASEVVDRVLAPFATLPAVAAAIHLGTRVVAISRDGFDKVRTAGRENAPFVIRAIRGDTPVEFRARAVIDASGTWSTPNPLGANGLPALGEVEHADAIVYGIPDVLGRDQARYRGRRTLVVGSGHSAANALLALAALAQHEPTTRIVWGVRTTSLARVFGGGAADALPARGALGTALRALSSSGGLALVEGLHVTGLRRHDAGTLTVTGTDPSGHPIAVEGIDQIICATGQRPDLGIVRELRVAVDPWLESAAALGPLIDPNVHSCGTVRPHGHRELAHPEPGFYTIGAKSYGRAPTFLMATGFEQARSVVAALAGDIAAADRVELVLPETGVCQSAGVTEVGEPRCCAPACAPTTAGADCCAGSSS
ncbi:MAG: GNAT family N-acetyltransferase [Ectothiorhodospiraceae bacterium]|nr:GNAT family N-acetyltransferase [Ectothiorhodospiraceae bacterium]